MASIEFELLDGLTVGADDKRRTYTRVVLREPTAGDILDAQEESEKLVYAVRGGDVIPTLVTSPSAMGIHVLRRQIVSIGDIKGPFDIAMLRLLSVADLDALQARAKDMADAADAAQAVQQAGRSDGAGEPPA